METNHRVHEVRMQDGRSQFYPQRKMVFLIWRPMMDPDWATPQVRKYHTLDEANDYLCDIVTDRLAEHNKKTVAKTINHPFNLVFEKLKKTDHD